MSVTYTNRKGQTFVLCKQETKTGKPRYVFARQPVGEIVEQIPDGYQIRESVNGVVSLARSHLQIITPAEKEIIEKLLKRHPKKENFRWDVKDTEIIIYEQIGPGAEELRIIFRSLGSFSPKVLDQHIKKHINKHARFAPILRFLLVDREKRTFRAARWYSRGTQEKWLVLSDSGPIEQLAQHIIPKLGTNSFDELF